jgi:hypothetical protein
VDFPGIVDRLTSQFTREVQRITGRRVTSIERQVITICAESMAASIMKVKREQHD